MRTIPMAPSLVTAVAAKRTPAKSSALLVEVSGIDFSAQYRSDMGLGVKLDYSYLHVGGIPCSPIRPPKLFSIQ